jgi:hypothetical protein
VGHADRKAVVSGEMRKSDFENQASRSLRSGEESSLRYCDRYEVICRLEDLSFTLLYTLA